LGRGIVILNDEQTRSTCESSLHFPDRAELAAHKLCFWQTILGSPYSSNASVSNVLEIQNIFKVVRVEGLEPPRLAAPEPKSGASANFATPATLLPITPKRPPVRGLLANAICHGEGKMRLKKCLFLPDFGRIRR
jgi:hypothetical protein